MGIVLLSCVRDFQKFNCLLNYHGVVLPFVIYLGHTQHAQRSWKRFIQHKRVLIAQQKDCTSSNTDLGFSSNGLRRVSTNESYSNTEQYGTLQWRQRSWFSSPSVSFSIYCTVDETHEKYGTYKNPLPWFVHTSPGYNELPHFIYVTCTSIHPSGRTNSQHTWNVLPSRANIPLMSNSTCLSTTREYTAVQTSCVLQS